MPPIRRKNLRQATMKTKILSDKKTEDIKFASDIIKSGGLVAFATETVYGLGADATNPDAVKKIFEAKGRPQDNPLIIHLSSPEEAEKYAYTSELYYKIADVFMPGPITVILPKKETIPDIVTGGLNSVAVRVPGYKKALEFIEMCKVPIAAPSANLSGSPSPTCFEHVKSDMDGRIDAILSGDISEIGVESTVVKITEENSVIICRPGGVTLEELKELIGEAHLDKSVTENFDGKPISPGMKYKHYAPKNKVFLLSGSEDEIVKFLKNKTNFVVICFDEDEKIMNTSKFISIGAKNDYKNQAHRLFDVLRKTDEIKGIDTIYARMPQKDGMGLAVLNRLLKAAAFETVELGGFAEV